MLIYKKLLIIVLVLLISEFTFSQERKLEKTPKQNAKINYDTTKKSGFYDASVIFQGNGLPNMLIYSCFGSNLNLLMKNIDSASKGAEVIFDYLKYIDYSGAVTYIKEIPYDFKRVNHKIESKSKIQQQIEELQSYKFISGIIYFSGYGFSNLLTVNANQVSMLNNCYSKSGSGTIITLVNCVYKNADGSLSIPLSKSINLE